MLDELRRFFPQHVRLRTGLEIFVDQTPDAAAAKVLVQLMLFHHRAQVGAGPHPIALLDDPAIHVHYI